MCRGCFLTNCFSFVFVFCFLFFVLGHGECYASDNYLIGGLCKCDIGYESEGKEREIHAHGCFLFFYLNLSMDGIKNNIYSINIFFFFLYTLHS